VFIDVFDDVSMNYVLLWWWKNINNYNAYNSKNANTKPIKPDTSTNEKPIKDQRINVFDNTGFLEILNNKNAKIIPTPIPTPANEINGILDAKYLNPNNIILTMTIPK